MTKHRPPWFGLLLATLALLMQLGAGLAMPAPVSVVDTATICHAGDDAPAPAAPHHSDCELCTLCTTAAGHAVFLRADAPAMPAPRVLPRFAAGAPPQATAPPAYERSTAQPRAPPILA
jgi:hypothetical protein